MSQERNQGRQDDQGRDLNANRLERESSLPNDLPDSAGDQEKLQPDETYIDLPDVKDIPGQEFVHVPAVSAIGDTTISSDDEEGRDVFDRDDSESFRRGNSADVGRDEKRALDQTDFLPTRDEQNLQDARMDNVDFQNEPLNERSFGEQRSGSDMDIPAGDDEAGGSSE
ncbi:MAG: hypothetical protein ACJ75B_12275 [Flavisolibacter sp.]